MHEDGSEAQCPLFSFGFYLLFYLSFVRRKIMILFRRNGTGRIYKLGNLQEQDREGSLTRRGVWASRQALYPAHGINPLSICDFAMPFDARLVVILEIKSLWRCGGLAIKDIVKCEESVTCEFDNKHLCIKGVRGRQGVSPAAVETKKSLCTLQSSILKASSK
jgi:hypothetical protein